MRYTITHEPKTRVHKIKPTTVTKDTAAEAWKLVDALMHSDEQVTINGGIMNWQELRILANEEAAE